MGGLSDAELAVAAANTLLPLLIAVIVRPTWSDRRRAVVALGVTLAVNVVVRLALTQAAALPNDWQAWLRFLLTCAVVSAVSFVSLWRATGVAGKVEAMTSPPSPARARLVGETERRVRSPRRSA